MLIDKNGLQLYTIAARNGLNVNYQVIINTSAINNGATAPPVSSGTAAVTIHQAAGVGTPQIDYITIAGLYLPGDVVSAIYGASTVSYTVITGDTNNSIATKLAANLNLVSAWTTPFTITVSGNIVVVTAKANNTAFTVTSSVVPAAALPTQFQIRNFGQSVAANVNETLTGLLSNTDSGTVETIVFTPTAIDGIPVKANSGLNQSYSVRLDNIVLVEPLWKRPLISSPCVIHVIEGGLYDKKAKSYTIPYTITQIWNYVLTGSY